MGSLGEDLLSKIVTLLDDPRDLCAVACASRMLRRLAGNDTVWKPLFESRRESKSWRGPPDTKYRERFRAITERERARARQAELRARLRLESDEQGKAQELRSAAAGLRDESEARARTASELARCEQLLSAEAAAKVWQPEVIRRRHEFLVESRPVDVGARVRTLQQELRLAATAVTTATRRHARLTSELEALRERLRQGKASEALAAAASAEERAARGFGTCLPEAGAKGAAAGPAPAAAARASRCGVGRQAAAPGAGDGEAVRTAGGSRGAAAEGKRARALTLPPATAEAAKGGGERQEVVWQSAAVVGEKGIGGKRPRW